MTEEVAFATSADRAQIAPVVESWVRYHGDPTLPSAWIVDVDGTIALMGDRGPFEWKRVNEDTLNLAVYLVVRGIAAMGVQIVYCSGRDAVCRPETVFWLERHGMLNPILYMRGEGDFRKDAIVKRELLGQIGKQWRVIGVLDDRDQVVEMWRAVGLPCFQVAEGAF